MRAFGKPNIKLQIMYHTLWCLLRDKKKPGSKLFGVPLYMYLERLCIDITGRATPRRCARLRGSGGEKGGCPRVCPGPAAPRPSRPTPPPPPSPAPAAIIWATAVGPRSPVSRDTWRPEEPPARGRSPIQRTEHGGESCSPVSR